MAEKKKNSIYEIANKAGVSIATVSRVLNNSSLVKDSTKKRVQKVIEELDYRPNFFARNLVKNKSKTIGLLIPDIINPVFPEMAKGISDKAFLKGYTVFLCNTESSVIKETEILKNLLEKNVAGVIFISTEMNKSRGDFQHYLYLYNNALVVCAGFLSFLDFSTIFSIAFCASFVLPSFSNLVTPFQSVS